MITAPDGFRYVDDVALLLGERAHCGYNDLLTVALDVKMPLPIAIKWAERKETSLPEVMNLP